MRRGSPTRRIIGVVGIVGLLLTFVAARPAEGAVAANSSNEVAALFGRVNSLRAERGAPPLVLLPELSSSAGAWSGHLADSGSLSHDPAAPGPLSVYWTRFAENVGYGTSLDVVWGLFVGSPAHLANMLDPSFTHIGIGVVHDDGGVLWTTHRYLRVESDAPPAPAPPPPAAPAPAAPVAPVAPPAWTPPVAAPPASAPPTTVAVTPPPAPPAAPPTTIGVPAPPADVDVHRVTAVLDAVRSIPT